MRMRLVVVVTFATTVAFLSVGQPGARADGPLDEALQKARPVPLAVGATVKGELKEADPTVALDDGGTEGPSAFRLYSLQAQPGARYRVYLKGQCKCFGFKKSVLWVAPKLFDSAGAPVAMEAVFPVTYRGLEAKAGVHNAAVWMTPVLPAGPYTLMVYSIAGHPGLIFNPSRFGTFSVEVTPRPDTPTPPKWSKDLAPLVDHALSLASSDPVSAALALKGAWDHGDPDAEQAVWLADRIAELRPRATAVLSDDASRAAAAADLRGLDLAGAATLSLSTGSRDLVTRAGNTKVRANGLLAAAIILPDIAMLTDAVVRTAPESAKLRQDILAGTGNPLLTWKLGPPRAEVLRGSYRETHAAGGLTIKPIDGFELVRVRATIGNVSDAADPSYALSTLGNTRWWLGRALQGPAPQQVRWLADRFVHLITADGEWLPQVHSCQGSSLATPGALWISGRPVYAALALPKGGTASLDGLFMVPAGSRDYRLLVLGSAPVPVAF